MSETLGTQNGRLMAGHHCYDLSSNPHAKGTKAHDDFVKAFTSEREVCEHDFAGWREFADGQGGERFCQKCGIGAMNYSMHFLP